MLLKPDLVCVLDREMCLLSVAFSVSPPDRRLVPVCYLRSYVCSRRERCLSIALSVTHLSNGDWFVRVAEDLVLCFRQARTMFL